MPVLRMLRRTELSCHNTLTVRNVSESDLWAKGFSPDASAS